MKCPVCSKEMAEENLGIKVDVCKNGCKGMWFDINELKLLDEKDEGLGDALQAALKYPRANDNDRAKIKCPKCNVPMHIHKYERQQEINVDECYSCAGFFLDSGELKAIRDNRMSDAEVEAYADRLINEVPEFQKAKQDLARQQARTEAIRQYTKFLRANYWMRK